MYRSYLGDRGVLILSMLVGAGIGFFLKYLTGYKDWPAIGAMTPLALIMINNLVKIGVDIIQARRRGERLPIEFPFLILIGIIFILLGVVIVNL